MDNQVSNRNMEEIMFAVNHKIVVRPIARVMIETIPLEE